MKKTLMAVFGVLLFGALASTGLAAPAQPATAGPGMTKMSQSKNRMTRISMGLDLTEEQKAKIKPILEEESVKVNAVLEDSTLSRQQKRTRVRDIHTATFERIKPLLTAEQLKKHEELMKSGNGMNNSMRQMTPANRLQKLSAALDLTEEQKAKIKPIFEDESAKIKSILEDSTLSRQQKRSKVRDIHAATFEQIKSVLTPEQLKKHEQMMKSGKGMYHRMGNITPANRLQNLSTALNLTEEQKARIKPMFENESVKIKAILEDSTLSRQQKRNKVRDIHAATFEQIKSVLTPEQLKKHEQMMKQWKK